jgi:hypothetical protein
MEMSLDTSTCASTSDDDQWMHMRTAPERSYVSMVQEVVEAKVKVKVKTDVPDPVADRRTKPTRAYHAPEQWVQLGGQSPDTAKCDRCSMTFLTLAPTPRTSSSSAFVCGACPETQFQIDVFDICTHGVRVTCLWCRDVAVCAIKDAEKYLGFVCFSCAMPSPFYVAATDK